MHLSSVVGSLLIVSAMFFGAAASAAGNETRSPSLSDPAALPTMLEGHLSAKANAALQRAMDAQTGVQALARHLADSPGLASLLERSVATDPSGRFAMKHAPPLPAYGTLSQALLALADATHTDVPASTLERLPAVQATLDPKLADIIIDLAGALVVAAQFRDQAFADLTPDETAFLERLPRTLLENLAVGEHTAADAAVLSPAVSAAGGLAEVLSRHGVDGERIEAIAGKVDLGALTTGAHVVLAAVDDALPRLQAMAAEGAYLGTGPFSGSVADAFSDGTDETPLSPTPPDCIPALPPPLSLAPLLVIGLPVAEDFSSSEDTLLSIDLGGDDAYCNNAGGTSDSGPSSFFDSTLVACDDLLPVALAIDVAGDDYYHSPHGPTGISTDASSVQFHCYEGSGFSGIGVLVDATGNDDYNSGKVLEDVAPTACPVPPVGFTPGPPPFGVPTFVTPTGVGFFDIFSQGGAFLGVGVLADLYGSDAYDSFNELCQEAEPTPLMFSVVASQGTGLDGVGLHLDAGIGHDFYNTGNTLTSLAATEPFDSFDVESVQGAGGNGIGVLLNLEGEEAYTSANTMLAETDVFPGTDLLFDVLCAQGCAFDAGIGILVDPLYSDAYHCNNFLVTMPRATTLGDGDMAYDLVQGAAYDASLGVLADASGYDCYNSFNTVETREAFLSIAAAQGYGAFSSVGTLVGSAVGVLVEGSGDDSYNSGNSLSGLTPSSVAGLVIAFTQGFGFDVGGLGVHADLLSVFGDAYNSGNTMVTATGDNFASIFLAQGSAAGPPGLPTPDLAVGVLLDLDPGTGGTSGDTYNSANGGFLSPSGAVAGALVILSAEGASGLSTGPMAMVFGPGAGIMVDVGGGNDYNVLNAFPPLPPAAGCAFPPFPSMAPGTCIDWVHGVAGMPANPEGVGVFVDLGDFGPPDDYGDPAFPADFGLDMYGTLFVGEAGVCIDAIDFAVAELPFDPFTPCTNL